MKQRIKIGEKVYIILKGAHLSDEDELLKDVKSLVEKAVAENRRENFLWEGKEAAVKELADDYGICVDWNATEDEVLRTLVLNRFDIPNFLYVNHGIILNRFGISNFLNVNNENDSGDDIYIGIWIELDEMQAEDAQDEIAALKRQVARLKNHLRQATDLLDNNLIEIVFNDKD